MVTGHQSKDAITDDKISDLSARDRWFRSVSWRVIANDKITDLSARDRYEPVTSRYIYVEGQGNDTTG